MGIPSLRKIITEPRDTTWWGTTILVIFWAVVGGTGYVTFGENTAGEVYYVIREAGGVVFNNTITLVLGLIMIAALRTRAAAITVLAFGTWCMWMAAALFFGFLWTGKGWLGWVTWFFFVLLSVRQFVIAPRSMFFVPKPKGIVVTHIPARDIVHKRAPAQKKLRTRTGDT